MEEILWKPPRLGETNDIRGAVAVDIALIALLWCLSVMLVNPVGNFPLIDDGIYGAAVEHFLKTGDYRPVAASMPLITNVLWGSLVGLVGGTSFTTLRFSTLLASFLGLIGIYTLVRDLQKPRWLAFAATLTLGFSPAYYALSHTFMTDVPFTALAIWATVFFARNLTSDSHYDFVLGTILALAATLSRQVALFVPIGYGAVLLLRRGIFPRTMLHASGPAVLCATALLAFNHWLRASGRLPELYYLFSDLLLLTLRDTKLLMDALAVNAYSALVQLGLFLLPLLLCTSGTRSRRDGRRATVLIVIGTVTMALAIWSRVRHEEAILMPLPNSHLLVGSGIGLLWLPDFTLFHLNNMLSLPEYFWILVTIAGLIGAVLLIAELTTYVLDLMPMFLRKRPIRDVDAVGAFLLLSGTIYVIPYLVIGSPERYLTPSMPFLLGAIVALSGRSPEIRPRLQTFLRISACALLAGFSLFAICGTHDYLAWNRTSWKALQYMVEKRHVDAKDIDGGIEFNLVHGNGLTSDVTAEMSAMKHAAPRLFDDMTDEDRKQIEWMLRAGKSAPFAHYMIAFGPVPGYEVVSEYTYHHWLPPRVQKIVVLRKYSVL